MASKEGRGLMLLRVPELERDHKGGGSDAAAMREDYVPDLAQTGYSLLVILCQFFCQKLFCVIDGSIIKIGV